MSNRPASPNEPSPEEPAVEIRRCERPECGLRFSSLETEPARLRCPRCRAVTRIVERLDAPLRVTQVKSHTTGPKISILLDNIRSAFNVGSMLRTAEGAGVHQAYFCGITPTPDLPGVRKTALGADQHLSWTSHLDGLALSESLVNEGKRLWALEGGARSESLFQIDPPGDQHEIVLVVGNEVAGVDPGIIKICERVLAIPMAGRKTSLNASIAFGIALYWIRYAGNINLDG